MKVVMYFWILKLYDMKQELNPFNLIEFQGESRKLYANNTHFNIYLYCTCNGNYIVIHNGEVICETMQANVACEAYNSITNK